MAKKDNKEKVLLGLLAASTVTEAAALSGVSERTIYRLLANEDFSSEYRQAQAVIVENAISQMQKAAGEAVETLRRNLTCGNPQAENSAAKIILENVLGTSDNGKSANREISITFNFNNSVRLSNG